MTAVVRKLKIKKEQGITLTAILDNSNPHHTHKIPQQQYLRLTITQLEVYLIVHLIELLLKMIIYWNYNNPTK